MPNNRLCWAKPDFPWGLDTTGNLDYAGRMTTFGNATPADFDRYAERSFAHDLDRYLAEQERAEQAHGVAIAEFGEDYEDTERDPEDFVSEADYFAPTAQDHADLAWVLDWEAFGGFHNP